jgi:FlaA1/EpsC-like NDP-sugar epimerase
LIADLARFMVRELSPDREVEIQFIAPRAGDKETEVMWSACDQITPAGVEGMVLVKTAQTIEAQLVTQLAKLRDAQIARDLRDALMHLHALVPDYTPSNAVLALAAQCSPRVCL